MLLEPEDLSAIVDRVIRTVTDPLIARIAALEARGDVVHVSKGSIGDPGPPGPPGKDADPLVIVDLLAKTFQPPRDGKDADPELMASMVTRAVAEAMAALPVPKDGADGADGTSVTPADVAPLVAEEVTKAIAAIPPAKDGADGADGANGADGISVTVDDVLPLIAEHVTKAVAALPTPKDGAPGASVDPADVEAMVKGQVAAVVDSWPRPTDGKDGKDGASVTVEDVAPLISAEVQKTIAAIPPAKDGKDGIGMVGTLIDRAGHLVVTLSDGETKDVGCVMGKDVDLAEVSRQIAETLATWQRPKDGIDGKDGFGFDDIGLRVDDDHGCFLTFTRGDLVKEFYIPTPFYRGTYKTESAYYKGNEVTYSSGQWIAKGDTTARPGEGATPWQLATKPGRDGKQGPTGEKGMDGKPGRDGKDGQWR